MDEQKTLEKIAYCYHEKFRAMGRADDKDRDWRYAVRAMLHLTKEVNYKDYQWRSDEDDYGEFRCLIS